MRTPGWRRLAVVSVSSLLASTLAAVSAATSAPAVAPGGVGQEPDPCSEASVLAEPAECVQARPGVGRGEAADRAPITPGNAFADGLVPNSGGDTDKLTFPPGDMTAPVQVADEATGINIFGYDFSPDGSVLYGVDNIASTLITVDQATGAATVVGPMTKTDPAHTWSDIVVDPVTGTAYAASVLSNTAYSLYTVNLATGATTPVNTVGTAATVIDMAMNCSGQLVALGVGDDSLYSVDPATGALGLIGSTGVSISFQQGMDFDNATGVLHAWLYIGSGVNQYSSLDLATGAATAFPGTEPLGEFEGAIRTSCPPPAVQVTGGPSGKTGSVRPAFSFSTGDATTVECSLDRGTPVFTPCAGTTYQPAADLAAGSWTFRVKGTRGVLTAQASRAFTVVDCASLKAAVAKAAKKVTKAKKKLKKAKETEDQQKIDKAKKKLKKAKKALRAAKNGLAAEPVCG